MKKEIELPSIEEIDVVFNKIKVSITKETKTEDAINILAKDFNNLLLIPTLELPLEVPVLKLYRVSKEYQGFDKNDLRCYSHPPENFTKMGRANIIGKPVLYCSDIASTAIKECLIENGGTFYLSEWELSFENLVKLYALGFELNVSKNDGIRKYIAGFIKSKYSKVDIEAVNHQQKKIGNLFSYPTDKYYNITSAYVYNVLYKSVGNDSVMLVFPSVKDKIGQNYVIPPRMVADKTIKMTKVRKLILNGENVTCLGEAYVVDEKLQWTSFE